MSGKDKMKLSIITINYNNAAGLKKTLDSVASQTCTDFEHIIVDGASTDGSVDEIIVYSQSPIANRHKITWLSEPDTGIYNAMNKGIKLAKGEYLLFLNSGDFLVASNILERVFAQNLDVDIINAQCNVSDNGKVIWTSPYLSKVTLKDLYFVGLPHQSTFIRRILFDKYGMYREDFRYNSDMDFWYRSIAIGNATTFGIDIVTTDYNLDGISTINAQTEAYKKEVREIFSQSFLPRVLPDYELWKEERNVYTRYSWIEEHRGLQKLLSIYYKVSNRLRKINVKYNRYLN